LKVKGLSRKNSSGGDR